MKVLVLGPSGGVGRHAVRQLLARGIAVTALVRPATVWDPPTGAVVVRADPLEEGAIAAALVGCDAVLSCLGIKRSVPANPWSRLADVAAWMIDRLERGDLVPRTPMISA